MRAVLLGAASQRVEVVVLEWFGTKWMLEVVEEWRRKERGGVLGFAEYGVVLFVSSKYSTTLSVVPTLWYRYFY